MHARIPMLSAGLAILLGLLLPARADAHVGMRTVKIQYHTFSGFGALFTDLKVYDNGDAELNVGPAILPTKRLKLTGAEYTSLVNLFSRYDFTSMPDHFPGHPVPDGGSTAITFHKTPHGPAKTVSSFLGASESHGYTVIKNALERLKGRVGEEGRQPGSLATTLSVVQHGPKVSLKFTVRNTGRETVMLAQPHAGHWFDFEAATGGHNVWTWSDGRMWPMIVVSPLALAPGKSMTANAEWEFVGSMSRLYQKFTFKAYTLDPRAEATKTVELGMPLKATGAPAGAAAEDGQPGGPGIIDGLNGGR